MSKSVIVLCVRGVPSESISFANKNVLLAKPQARVYDLLAQVAVFWLGMYGLPFWLIMRRNAELAVQNSAVCGKTYRANR